MTGEEAHRQYRRAIAPQLPFSIHLYLIKQIQTPIPILRRNAQTYINEFKIQKIKFFYYN